MDFNANTIENARNYLNIRYHELASIKIIPSKEIEYEDKAIITLYNNDLSSIYILNDHRGKGLYKKLVNHFNIKVIVTMNECNISSYLTKNNINKLIVSPSQSYTLIKNYYGDKVTKRSGVKLMNHINEGLTILNNLDAEQFVLDAYCLHPLFQSVDDFNKNINLDLNNIDPKALILAIEYRRVANSYLSHMKPENFVGFTNNYIKQMLYADKVQNEKDFRIYHEGKHPRSKELREYFDYWLKNLLV